MLFLRPVLCKKNKKEKKKEKKRALLYLWKRTDLTSVTTSRLALYPAHTMATWMVCGDHEEREVAE